MTTPHTASLLRGFAAYENRPQSWNENVDRHFDKFEAERAQRVQVAENIDRALGIRAEPAPPPYLTRRLSSGEWVVVRSGVQVASGFDHESEAIEWINDQCS
jgi:hypothetical protein